MPRASLVAGPGRTRARRSSRIRAFAGGALLVLAVLAMPASVALTAEETSQEAPALDAALVEEVLGILGERYVDDAALSTQNLTEGALRGILEALGDEGHTAYLSPAEYAAEQDALEGRVLGIGVVLDERSKTPVIISVIDGSPADRAGLRAGDVIARVDDLDAVRLDLGEIAELVRGAAGSTVRLGIERPGSGQRLDVSIIREEVVIDPADWARVPGTDLAAVRIVQFSSGAGEEARGAVGEAIDGGTTGIVLDLRGNPGGLVQEALEVAGAFADGGVAYREVDREGEVRDVSIPAGRTISTDVPIIVLVDYATASSAEILAVALRDNDRATIVGERTFGTGTVLNTFGLSDGSALKVGVRRWLTPLGESVFGVGVRPDHEVDPELGSTLLRPSELVTMTPAEVATSDDLALRRAAALLEPNAAP